MNFPWDSAFTRRICGDGASEFKSSIKIFLPWNRPWQPSSCSTGLANGTILWRQNCISQKSISIRCKWRFMKSSNPTSTMTESGSTDFIVKQRPVGVQLAIDHHDSANFNYISIASNTLSAVWWPVSKRIERGIDMKKVVGGLLAASALLSLAACGGSSDNASSSDFLSKIGMS